MKETTQKPFNRVTPAGKTYRLICISAPGRKTGRQPDNRAATAMVQTGEHAAGQQGSRQELPADGLLKKPAVTVPEVSDTVRQERMGGFRPEMPAGIRPEVPAGDRLPEPGTRCVPAPVTPAIPAGRIYRLICISIPGKKTGRQPDNRAAPAAVQAGEHMMKQPGNQSQLPGKNRHQLQVAPGSCITEMPAGDRPQVPEQPGTLMPAGCLPQIPRGIVSPGPAIPANNSAEQSAPDTAGGDAV